MRNTFKYRCAECGADRARIHAQALTFEAKAKMARLTYRERAIIKLRDGIGHDAPYTADEVRRIFKITKHRVAQLEVSARAKLQQAEGKQANAS